MEKYNVPMIIICTILLIFLISTFLYIFNSNDIRNNNETKISRNEPSEELETSPKLKKINEATKVFTKNIEIASYTTKIYDNDKNRVYNIKLACKYLDKTVIKKNEEFSFNSVLGNMGEAEGYKKATGFDSNGNDIKVFGGGICQLSSTLYNAALIAKLKITERHAHSKRVYYVPKNKDATVFSNGPDLKFINNTDSNIIINSTSDGYTVTVSLNTEKNNV